MIKLIEEQKIILHIDKESKEFLEDSQIRSLLTKYNKFMPIPIKLGTKEITKTEGEGEDAKEIKELVDDIINNLHPHGLRNLQISKMKTIIVFIENSIRCNLKIHYFRFI